MVALSSCETEYISVSMCVCQALWLMNLLKELGSSVEKVITLLVDNISAINLARNPIAHGRRKHIEICFHYLRKMVCASQLKLGKC